MIQSTKNILIVDDVIDLRIALRTLLEMSDFRVFEAEDGSKALELLERQSIDLIISDIRMPNCDGIDFFKRLDRSRIKIPFVFMSGYSDITENEVKSMGAISLISKPFNIETILSTIGVALKSNQDETPIKGSVCDE